jgi:hypothetical protein
MWRTGIPRPRFATAKVIPLQVAYTSGIPQPQLTSQSPLQFSNLHFTPWGALTLRYETTTAHTFTSFGAQKSTIHAAPGIALAAAQPTGGLSLKVGGLAVP